MHAPCTFSQPTIHPSIRYLVRLSVCLSAHSICLFVRLVGKQVHSSFHSIPFIIIAICYHLKQFSFFISAAADEDEDENDDDDEAVKTSVCRSAFVCLAFSFFYLVFSNSLPLSSILLFHFDWSYYVRQSV